MAEQGSSGDEVSINDALTPDGRVGSREDQPDPRLDQSTDILQNDSPLDETEKKHLMGVLSIPDLRLLNDLLS